MAHVIREASQVILEAEGGNAEAQCELAHMYQDGEGMAQDDQEALFWFRKAAEQGDAHGQYMLGEMYYRPAYISGG